MRAIGAGGRIFELLEREPLIPISQGAQLTSGSGGNILFDGVCFEYPSRKGVDVLENLHLQLNAGECVAVV